MGEGFDILKRSETGIRGGVKETVRTERCSVGVFNGPLPSRYSLTKR